MSDDLDLGLALRFLSKWFDANKDQYEAAMAQFEVLVGRLIEDMSGLEGLAPRDCIMRIYRDVRFSKDKSPYRTGLGAGIAPGGRKSGRLGYHLHFAPGGATIVASGLWDPTPEQLSSFRGAIVKDASAFKKILGDASFKRHFNGLYGEVLKTAPKGYPADHPEIELLRRKQVCLTEPFTDDVVASQRFPALALQSMKAMKPFIDYLNRVTLQGRR